MPPIMTDARPEVLFYHLERQSLEQVLPSMLEKVVERNWKAVVHVGSQERLEALDLALWTYRDDSFLAHGTAKDGHADRQPIFLSVDEINPNGAGVRFLVDGAEAADYAGYARVVYLFDGKDESAVGSARQQWKKAKAAGCVCTYWQQSAAGRWEKKA